MSVHSERNGLTRTAIRDMPRASRWHTSVFSRQHPPEFCNHVRPQRRERSATLKEGRGRPSREGAGNAGCTVHPQPVCSKKHTVVTTGPPKTPGIPCAMVLTVSFVLSPATNSSCHRRPWTNCASKSGRTSCASTSLTSATDARTTRLRRTQRPHRYPFDRQVCRRSKVWRRH